MASKKSKGNKWKEKDGVRCQNEGDVNVGSSKSAPDWVGHMDMTPEDIQTVAQTMLSYWDERRLSMRNNTIRRSGYKRLISTAAATESLENFAEGTLKPEDIQKIVKAMKAHGNAKVLPRNIKYSQPDSLSKSMEQPQSNSQINDILQADSKKNKSHGEGSNDENAQNQSQNQTSSKKKNKKKKRVKRIEEENDQNESTNEGNVDQIEIPLQVSKNQKTVEDEAKVNETVSNQKQENHEQSDKILHVTKFSCTDSEKRPIIHSDRIIEQVSSTSNDKQYNDAEAAELLGQLMQQVRQTLNMFPETLRQPVDIRLNGDGSYVVCRNDVVDQACQAKILTADEQESAWRRDFCYALKNQRLFETEEMLMENEGMLKNEESDMMTNMIQESLVLSSFESDSEASYENKPQEPL